MSRDVTNAARVTLVMRRVGLGLNQRELAEQMGVTQSALAHAENHTSEKSQVVTLKRWAEALGGTLKITVVFDDLDKAADRARRAADIESGAGGDFRTWDVMSEESRKYWRAVAEAVRNDA